MLQEGEQGAGGQAEQLVAEKVKIFDKGVDLKTVEGWHEARVKYRTGDMYAPALERTEQDLNLKWIMAAIGVMAIPMFFLYRYFAASTPGALESPGASPWSVP